VLYSNLITEVPLIVGSLLILILILVLSLFLLLLLL